MKNANNFQTWGWVTAGGLFIISLGLYVATLAPSVVTLFDDSLEFQLVTYQLAIAHPTGYPLYTLLGKLFTYVPIGNIAYRVNLLSAVFGAAAVALLYLLIYQISLIKNPERFSSFLSLLSMGPVYVGSVVGALLLAVGPVFWRQATVAEVYTLNAFFVILILLVATTARPESLRTTYWLAFLFGLSLTHHRTMLLLSPGLVAYLLLVYRTRLFSIRVVLLTVLLAVLPLLLYLYLPLRGHIGSLDGTYENTWTGFWRHVTASGYGTFIFENPFGQERGFAYYFGLLADQFYTTVLGFIGLIYLFRRGPYKVLVLTGFTFLSYFTFNIFYNVADIDVFFIPVFLIWAVWSGIGAIFLLETAAKFKLTAWRLPLVGLLLAVFAIMIIQLFRSGYPAYTWQIHDYGLDLLQQPDLDEKPVIVGILGEITLIRYFQQTENRRLDIETVAADLEAERMAAVENLLDEGNSVYLTRELDGIAERYSLRAVGPLIKVNPEPISTPPEVANLVNQTVAPGITLVGYTVSRVPHTGDGPAPVRLTLVWQVDAPLEADLKVSARLLNPDGETQAVVDAAPVHFAYPTSAWRPNEIITDVYDLVLPPDTPPGSYTPLIIWYDPAQNAAEVGRIELPPFSFRTYANMSSFGFAQDKL